MPPTQKNTNQRQKISLSKSYKATQTKVNTNTATVHDTKIKKQNYTKKNVKETTKRLQLSYPQKTNIDQSIKKRLFQSPQQKSKCQQKPFTHQLSNKAVNYYPKHSLQQILSPEYQKRLTTQILMNDLRQQNAKLTRQNRQLIDKQYLAQQKQNEYLYKIAKLNFLLQIKKQKSKRN